MINCIARHAQNNNFAISLQYLKKNGMECYHFRCVCVARHAQITQNNKFAISLQYLKKEVSDEVDFLHVDKHENFIQINSMVLDGDG